jgi:hypothetical protein
MMGRYPLAALLLAASACSPGAAPNPAVNEQDAQPNTTKSNLAAAAPAKPSAAAPAPREADSSPGGGQRRCGWLSNPTPANWWLTDRDGEWILGTQGGEQAPGMDEMPDMSTAGWVETNGHYGYGCACMTIAHDPATGRVTRIADAEPKPLKQCQADRSLPKPE